MSKRTSKFNPREKSPGSSDSEEHRPGSTISKEELLNPSDALFRTRHYTTDDEPSDFERLSRHGSRIDISQLTTEERLQLRRELDSGEDTLHNRVDQEYDDGEDEETEKDSDEEDEEQPEGISEAKRAEINKEMPFLVQVPNQQIPEVLIIIQHADFTIENKLKYMEDYLTVKALRECELYFKNERCDFMKCAPGTPHRNVAQQALDKKNYDDLKKIVENWGVGAQTALKFWLERLNGSQAAEDSQIPVKESPKRDKKTMKKEKTPKEEKKKEKEPSSSKKEKDEKKTTKKASKNAPETPEKDSTPKKGDKKDGDKKKHRHRDMFSPSSHKRVEPSYSDIEGVPFNKEIFDRCPHTMNIVLMGGTGVGKSSFINNFVNLLSFSNLQDAEQNNFHVLIPASFTHVTADYKKIPIRMKPNVKVEKLGDVEEQNEVDTAGASATQAPKSYLFSWGPAKNKKYIRLIDTPGVGDTRGTLVDNKNFARILDFIAGFKEIHAICILLKANEARSGIIFRYCHNQLFGHLHQSATKNIFFCFTNTRGADYGPGDTYRTLSGELDKLPQKIDVDGKYFCFDSESFRYLCSRKNKIEFDADALSGYRTSFDRSKKQIFKLIKAITDVEPHMVDKTLDVNNARRLIMALLRPIAELTKSIMITTRMLEEQIVEVEEAERRGTDVRQKMNIQVPKLTTKNLEYPMTVCASPGCTERKSINGIDQIHYKTVCHNHCHLHGVQTTILNNTALQNCSALAGHIHKCSNCSCSWEMHMHITYKLDTIWGDAIDSSKQNELKKITDRKALSEQLIVYYKQRIAEFNGEKNKVLVFLADALAFLKKHSIVPVNDAFVEYLDHMIKQEEVKVQHEGDDTLLKELNDYRDQYRELLKQQSELKTYRVKTTGEMYEMIEQLKRMAQNGAIFKEVQDLDVLQLKNLPAGDAQTVDLNIGWLGFIFYKMGQITKKFLG